VNIALFGGTFDPIHSGHLRVAETAARRFRLQQILFVPSGTPPHKYHDRLTDFAHRFAMVALACAGNRRFVPSLLEAPESKKRPQYSIQTVRAVRNRLGPGDQLYFLVGLDAFLDLPHWKDYRRLLGMVNFIVVPRPGFSGRRVSEVIPPDMVVSGARTSGEVRLRHTTVHVLEGGSIPVASRDIRVAIRTGRQVTGLVPPLVKEYILKEGLYRPAQPGPTRC
jgi:nicotinate-nucleotide adenylyltransferase